MGTSDEFACDSLHDCKAALEAYLEQLEGASSQISSSADQCAAAVESAFASLMKQLHTVLDTRKQLLLSEITDVKQKALAQTEECRWLAVEQLRQADQLLGCSAADADDEQLQSTLLEAAQDLLPSLPSLSGAPRVALHVSSDALLAAAGQWGRVRVGSPVGAVTTEARPGAVKVTWAQSDSGDDETDGAICRLQYCYGDANKVHAPVYHTVYEGVDTSALVRRLQRDVTYSFRVGRQAAAGSPWTDWSTPVIGSTTLPHYEWAPSADYTLSDAGRIAVRALPADGGGGGGGGGGGALLTRGPQLTPAAALRVLVVEAGAGCSDEGLALLDSAEAVREGCLAVPGALFVSATGEVYVDGERRQMRLPALAAGSQVTFTTERRPQQQSTRVWVETGDKQVVYDWRAKSTDLWLAASFNELGWKLLLE